MLSLDVKKWSDELQSGKDNRDQHLEAMKEMVQAAHGPHYCRGEVGRFLPENHYHSYTSLMVPRLIMDNPRVRCSTRRPGSQMAVAEAIRHGLNRWSRDTNIRNEGARVAVDYLYNWGWMMIRQIPTKNMRAEDEWIWDKDGTFRVKGENLWPRAYRIAQDAVLVDPQAFHLDEARWIAHQWTTDVEDLRAEAKAHPDRGWNDKVLASLGARSEWTDTESRDPLNIHDKKTDPERSRVVAYTVWVPELQLEGEPGPDEGYHGTLLTLGHVEGGPDGLRGTTQWLRKPRPYYGPPQGPYVPFGAYTLPNKLWPLSPLVAVEGQVRELNRHARAWSRSAERHKRIILYNEKDAKTAAKLKRAQHDFFVGIPGFDKAKFAEAEIGGATDAQYKAYAFLQDRLSRVSSMDDAQMGQATGAATATENTIADETSTTRMSFLKQQYSDAMGEVFRRVAWYMYHDDRVVFPLGEEAADDLGMEEPWFHGGVHEEDSDATFDDLELEIEPYSMERTDQAGVLQRTMAAANFIVSTAPLIPQLPYVAWDELYDLVGDAMNMPHTAELVDVEAGLAAEPFQQGSQPDQPRLERDVGAGYGGQPQQNRGGALSAGVGPGGMQNPAAVPGRSIGEGTRMKGLAGAGTTGGGA